MTTYIYRINIYIYVHIFFPLFFFLCLNVAVLIFDVVHIMLRSCRCDFCSFGLLSNENRTLDPLGTVFGLDDDWVVGIFRVGHKKVVSTPLKTNECPLKREYFNRTYI